MFENELRTLFASKEDLGYTWGDIANILNKKYHTNFSADACRKRCSRYHEDEDQLVFQLDNEDEVQPEINVKEEFNVRKEIQRLKDERNQLNGLYRQFSREDLLRDIAKECASEISKSYPFKDAFKPLKKNDGQDREGILLLSDWHYGISIDNHWNKYNPEICKTRLGILFSEVVRFIGQYSISTLYVVNLGDLISGRIHSQLRIENREDAISQVMHVSELLASFLYELSKVVNIEYYDCLDNHSRIEPNIKESLRLESLARIITWYLKERFYDIPNVNINFNEYSDDILSFQTKKQKWNVVGVHGDLDSQRAVIKNMRGMLNERPDLVCTAHLHHFSANEENECVLVSNPSLMGTDGFAESKRLTSRPAQTLIVTDEYSPAFAIHRIVID
jgi:hypothetical protein